jgi:hypothetical protein
VQQHFTAESEYPAIKITTILSRRTKPNWKNNLETFVSDEEQNSIHGNYSEQRHNEQLKKIDKGSDSKARYSQVDRRT